MSSRWHAHLAGIPLFAACTDKELARIAKVVDEVTLPAGTVVVRQDEPGHECYLLVEGTATVERNGTVLTTLGPGAPFGELALLDGGPRTATVTLVEDARLLVLGQRELAALLDTIPGLTHKVLRNLAARVRALDEQLFS